jgi:hypothetical protein
LTKIEQKAPELLPLAKHAQVALGASALNGQKSKLALCLDYSGSMANEYRSGAMQRLSEKVLALGTQLDDDGVIDLFVFDHDAAYLGEVSIDNFQGSVDRLTKGRSMSTTNYAAAFKLIEKHYGFGGSTGGFGGLFGKKSGRAALKSPAKDPVLVVFLTDGVPNNQQDAVRAITDASYAPIFWQFLSIGRDSIPFLEKLDDLDGRYIDNADYKPVGNVDKLTGEQLIELILDEYPAWVLEERRRGQIV